MKPLFTSVAWIAASMVLRSVLAAESFSNSTCSANNGSICSVTGVQGTGIQPRLEIRELEKNKEMFNLFLLALARFQATDQNSKLSYFQIAGMAVLKDST
jgi:tyrosinase